MAKGNPRRANGSGRSALTRWLRSQGRPCWICGMPIDYGAPPGAPLSFNCDELLPVARGGSPYSKANVDAAHACCNGWRKTKGVGEVVAARAAVAARFGGWSSPLDFVAKAKALRKSPRLAPKGAQSASRPTVRADSLTTTEWL